MKYAIILALLSSCASNTARRTSGDEAQILTRDGDVVPTTPLRAPLAIATCPPAEANGECLLPNEAELTQQIAGAAAKFQGVQNPKPISPSQRDFHPKHHACLAGKWIPLASAPAELQIGSLAPRDARAVVLRFSNGSPKSPTGNNAVSPDGRPDARGLGIKVVGVPGKSVIITENEADSSFNQDFVLINFPSFFLRSAKSYPAFFAAITAGKPFLSMMDPGELKVLKDTNRMVADVIAETFFSQTPYKLGAGFAKYRVRECEPETAAPPTATELEDPDYLRKRIRARLGRGDICLLFAVQSRVPSMNVEDASTIWPETQSPFVNVARIEIPGAQDINDPARNSYCENISFNPWNSAPENRPAGSINRARLGAYSGVSRKRRMENSVPVREPLASDAFFSVLK